MKGRILSYVIFLLNRTLFTGEGRIIEHFPFPPLCLPTLLLLVRERAAAGPEAVLNASNEAGAES